MMNRPPSIPSSSDPYHHLPPPSIMPFVGLDNNWDTHIHTQTIPSFDPPFALPMTTPSFPFYQRMDYPSPNCFIKREENNHYTTTGPGRIGLNLGHRTYFSSVDALAIDRLLTPRAHHQPPRCQAEGCKADLSGAKQYHRRHKVCEFHSKATNVVAGGLRQRFCQQCSRFHVLAEFDESKRSCRKRLADHNRRRRKPQNNNNYNNSADKTKNNAPRPSRDCASKSTSAASKSTSAATPTTNSGGGLEGRQGEQSMEVLFRSGPALSLGAQEGMSNYYPSTSYNNQGDQSKAVLFSSGPALSLGAQQGMYNYHPSTSYNNSIGGFYHQSLFGSSSNEASQSNGGGSDQIQNQTNLLHLGQAMFEVDLM